MSDISKLPKPVELAFAKIEPTSNVDNTKAPVIIYHGIFASKDSWVNPIGREIAEKTQRTVYCLDVRDHGDSPWTDEFSLPAMIADAVHFLNKHKIEKAVLLGHSLGGLIFSRLSTLFPNLVEKLVLVDIHPKKKESADSGKAVAMIRLFSEMLKKAINTIQEKNLDLEAAKALMVEMLRPFVKDEPHLKQHAEKLKVDPDGKIAWKFNLDATVEFIANLGKIEDMEVFYEGPVLEIYGSLSEFFTKEDYESVRKMMPNARFESIENADHIVNSTHPKKFVEKVVPFINE